MTTKKKVRKNSAKAKTSSKKTITSSLKRSSKKIVDQVLAKIPPQLQNRIDYLIATLENSKDTKLHDLTLLASKILIRAQEVSKQLRTLQQNKIKKNQGLH